jgi:hypothetical protein
MTSTRQSACFLIDSSAVGQVIRNCSKIRKQHGGTGPFIKVHQNTSQLVALDECRRTSHTDAGSIYMVSWGGKLLKLHIGEDASPDAEGNIRVTLVEASSWNKSTTIDMVCALWKIAVSKQQIFKEHYDVEGSAQDKGTVIRMVIGRGGANLRRLVARRGKAYVDRDAGPNRFIIVANTMKDALGIKHDIQREARKISSDVAHRSIIPAHPAHKFPKTDKQSWFGLFADAGEESSDDEGDVDAYAQSGPRPRNFGGSTPSSSKPTLAEMLEDSAARGDAFSVSPALAAKRADEERIRMVKHVDTSSSDDDMPPLIFGEGEDIFSTIAENCGNTDEWGME